VVEDLGSSNGTFVNGEPIHGPRTLAPGDRIRCGLTVLQVRSTEQVAARPSVAVATPTVTSLVPAATPAPPAPPPLRVEQRPPAYVPEQALGLPRAEQNYEAIEQLVDSRVKQRARVAGIAAMSISALIVLLYFGLR
jgi:pSer/pThr/pTyr-binding forkhead associated (FHA) protein